MRTDVKPRCAHHISQHQGQPRRRYQQLRACYDAIRSIGPLPRRQPVKDLCGFGPKDQHQVEPPLREQLRRVEVNDNPARLHDGLQLIQQLQYARTRRVTGGGGGAVHTRLHGLDNTQSRAAMPATTAGRCTRPFLILQPAPRTRSSESSSSTTASRKVSSAPAWNPRSRICTAAEHNSCDVRSHGHHVSNVGPSSRTRMRTLT